MTLIETETVMVVIDRFVEEGLSVALYEKWLKVGAVKSHASSTQVERKKANIHAWLSSTRSKLNMFLNEVLSGWSRACGRVDSLTVSQGLTQTRLSPKQLGNK